MNNQGYPFANQPPTSNQPQPGAWYYPTGTPSGSTGSPMPQNGYSGGFAGYNGYTPKPAPRTVQPQSAKRSGGGSGGGKRPPANRKPAKQPPRKKKTHTLRNALILLVLVAALVAGGTYAYRVRSVENYVKPYANVFADNVYVDGLNLSGMTYEQGASAVQAQIDSKLGSWYVRLRNSSGEYKDITAATLGISRDPSSALTQAWAIAHVTDTPKDNATLKAEIDAAKSSTYEFSSVEQSADTSPIDTILSMLEQAAYVQPQNAALLSFNPDDSSNPFTYQYEVVGKRLDTASVKAQILEMVETFTSGEVLVEPIDVQPTVTVADLQQQYALRGRAVTPISSTSTDDRNNNIRVAFSKMNGMIMEVNQKFSFNTIVGRRTTANGFYAAFEYSYGELTPGVGGGVCQASTTVYLAAAYAGLKIVDHTSHSTSVSYTDMGLDATVSDTRGHEVDFSFKNDTTGRLFIAAHVIKDPNNSKRLMTEVRIYGPDLGNTRYTLETELVETLPAPTEPEIIKDKDAKYVTYTDEEKVVIKSTEGYVYDTYRVTTVGGVVTDRSKLARSTYKNRAERIYVGVTERDALN